MDKKSACAYAMKLIYEWEMGGDGGEETRLELLSIQPDEDGAEYMNRLFAGVVQNAPQLDAEISQYLRSWTLERLSRVDLAILRLGAYEMIYGGVPAAFAINTAVELANEYSTDKAGSFVNGVLGNLSRALSRAEG